MSWNTSIRFQGTGETTSISGLAAALGYGTMERNIPIPMFRTKTRPWKKGRRPSREVIQEGGEILVNSRETNVLSEYYHHSNPSLHQ